MRKTLPPHLKNLAKQIEQGKDLSGKPLDNESRKKLTKIMGASYFKSKEGKIKKI